MTTLPASFFEHESVDVARDLLGKILVRKARGGFLKGRIVEVEAYTGETDPGSHAFRGQTPRNRVMFGPAGHLYVYISYGIHFCLNVVTDRPGTAGAVLVRALEPMAGLDIMERNRGGRPPIELCNGPGKLCQAFGITTKQNGADLQTSGTTIDDDGFLPETVAVSTRVGVTTGAELPLRFYLPGNRFVSRGKPSMPQRNVSHCQ